ncbi:ankyrin repeat domain-containing protein [Streptomyces avidinii]|uniref:ankyrin repeat domain-containing protein n=1 Tax=Streptomyces avidinii TaxID=1895 RepID=UPI0037A190FB
MGDEGKPMAELAGRLVAAVASGDAAAVRELLADGADADTVGADGLPVLCAAVAVFASETAEALVEGGADPDRVLPDGTTALLRAVEGGSPATVEAVLGQDARLRLPEDGRRRLLDVARRWYGAGAEPELRRLTGARGPVRAATVQDSTYDRVEEVTLGGRTVRAGHGAVLTLLEWEFRILAPVEELVARAVRHGDEDHVDWSASCRVLGQRASAEAWTQVVEFHRHPGRLHRLFAAGFLRMMTIGTAHVSWYEKRRVAVLTGWAETEQDGGVLSRVLDALTAETSAGARALGLRHAGHADPRVRMQVPYLFEDALDDETARVVRALGRDPHAGVRGAVADRLQGEVLRDGDREVVLALLRDGDRLVRESAAHAAARSPDRSPEITEALVELLDAEEQDVRLSAAYGLAWRDDPRTPGAYAKVGPLGPEAAYDHRVDALWRWRSRNEPAG